MNSKMFGDLPDEYTVGEEFVKDKERIDVEIVCTFSTSAVLSNLRFISDNYSVETEQIGHDFIIKIKRQISKKLFHALMSTTAEIFLMGYIDEVLPEINRSISEQIYLNGHLLNKTYSILDIKKLIVINLNDKKFMELGCPIVVQAFPPSASLAKSSDSIFIRDYIDSMYCYFTYNLDDCIRKMITSLENFFRVTGITTKEKDESFNTRLDRCLNKVLYASNYAPYLYILKKNIKFIYKCRKGIVHDRFRMDFKNRWLCKKGIGTLSYIYKSSLLDIDTIKYIISLSQQFLLLNTLICGIPLDEYVEGINNPDEGTLITSGDDLDKFMFSGLEIGADEQERVLG